MKFRIDGNLLVVTQATRIEYHQLKNHLTRHVKNHRFHPRVKAGVWDGQISYFNGGKINIGLWKECFLLCQKNQWKFEIENKQDFPMDRDITYEKFEGFCLDFFKDHKQKDGVTPFYPYDHQMQSAFKILRNRYCITEVATGGGKSFIFALVVFYVLREVAPDARFLLMVPNISLVCQFTDDIKEYNEGVHGENKNPLPLGVDEIMSDKPRRSEGQANIFIGTSASLEKRPKEWFHQFYGVVADECLHPDTLISMADGTHKPICDVVKGDLVFTINEQTGVLETKPVDYVYENLNVGEQMYTLETESGVILEVTGNHKVRLLGNIEWKRVDELTLDDGVLAFHNALKLKSIKKNPYAGDVYNLRIADTPENAHNHNYFANELCVSNCHKAGQGADSTVKQIAKVLERTMNHATLRFGMSGTFPEDGSLDYLTIQNLTGPKIAEVRADLLMAKGVISPVKINSLILNHNDLEFNNNVTFLKRGGQGKTAYDLEKKYVQHSEKRMDFVFDKILSKITKNTLVLFHITEYGERIYQRALDTLENAECYHIDGGTKSSVREDIKVRMEVTTGKPKLLIASFGTLSTGVSVKSLCNVVFMESYKSEQIIIQSIGRALRLHAEKETAIIFDVVDTFAPSKGNVLYAHYLERKGFYTARNYPNRELIVNL